MQEVTYNFKLKGERIFPRGKTDVKYKIISEFDRNNSFKDKIDFPPR